MKWVVIIVILIIVLSFVVVIKRQNEYNKEELKRAQILQGVANFGVSNIENIQNQKFSIVDRFVNSKFVTVTSGIFGKVWGTVVGA